MLPAPAEKPAVYASQGFQMLAETPTAQYASGVALEPPSPRPDLCRADELKWLIGKPKSKIPAPRDGETRRILCTECAATMDYLPGRLNILYEKKSGIVRELKCG